MTHQEAIVKIEAVLAELRHAAPTPTPTSLSATKSPVSNRGVPPDSFLSELILWASSAPESIFLENTSYDIYSTLYGELGPYPSLLNRRAVLCEALRVLGGFESSWDWIEGRDSTNPNTDSPANEEAGIFQTSYDSVAFDPSLRDCMNRYGVKDAHQFIAETKNNHLFALEYTARLLRFTINHHGPIKRQEIDAWVKRSAVAEFEFAISSLS